MSNVLGTLFGDIAAAIRSKNGEEDTMKPAEFPGKISALTVASPENSGLKFAEGEFTPPLSGSITVTHDMGVVPDVVVIFPGEAGTMSGLLASIGFSEAALEATGGQTTVYLPGGGSLGTNYPIEMNVQQMADMGVPRGATETLFYVGGGTTYNYPSTVKYRWIALGNLFNA